MSAWEQAGQAAAWWRALQPGDSNAGDRATLARLRHAATLLDAVDVEATIRLAQRLGGRPALENAALCAAVLASVRDSDEQPIARRVGPRDDAAPKMSPLRFRRLIQAESWEDRLVQFRRLVALAEYRANVPDLAAALLDWSDRRRRDWIFRYYNAEPPKSDTAPQPTSNGAAA